MNLKVYKLIFTPANLYSVSIGIEENIQSIYSKINQPKNCNILNYNNITQIEKLNRQRIKINIFV
jgi:hypothetical protein